ncbi:MAG: hypothetical protein JWM77_2455 [Rhodospirillales bacterium]|jgi:hypothetical protein|nr:hypothetical protein [Rhodospirillales bacterium]
MTTLIAGVAAAVLVFFGGRTRPSTSLAADQFQANWTTIRS